MSFRAGFFAGLRELGVHILGEKIVHGLGNAAGTAAENQIKKSAEVSNCRPLIMDDWRFLEGDPAGGDTASKNLLEWHGKRDRKEHPYKPGDENRLMSSLTPLYKAFKDDRERRMEIWKWLGNMTEEEFNHKVNALDQDNVRQFFRLLLWPFRNLKKKKFWEGVDNDLGPLADFLESLPGAKRSRRLEPRASSQPEPQNPNPSNPDNREIVINAEMEEGKRK